MLLKTKGIKIGKAAKIAAHKMSKGKGKAKK
jgi:hypothetical protein